MVLSLETQSLSLKAEYGKTLPFRYAEYETDKFSCLNVFKIVRTTCLLSANPLPDKFPDGVVLMHSFERTFFVGLHRKGVLSVS